MLGDFLATVEFLSNSLMNEQPEVALARWNSIMAFFELLLAGEALSGEELRQPPFPHAKDPAQFATIFEGFFPTFQDLLAQPGMPLIVRLLHILNTLDLKSEFPLKLRLKQCKYTA